MNLVLPVFVVCVLVGAGYMVLLSWDTTRKKHNRVEKIQIHQSARETTQAAINSIKETETKAASQEQRLERTLDPKSVRLARIKLGLESRQRGNRE